jgi:hypothetical protein
MPTAILTLLPLLIQAAPTIFKMGADAVAGFKALVAAMKLKAGTAEEKAALDVIEAHLRLLDIQVANVALPD